MAEGREFTPPLLGQIPILRSKGLGDDELMAWLGARQHGRASYAQLRGLGTGDAAIENRVRRGRLRRVHRGVYAIGHQAPSWHARWMAAVLAVDGQMGMRPCPRAALSLVSAAALLGAMSARAGPIHVTSPEKRRGCDGVVVHRGRLPLDELVIRDQIVVTSPARTLLDLAGVLTDARLERVVRECEFQRLVTFRDIEEILERYPRRRGRRRLHEIVARAGGERGRTRSGLEDDFRRFIRRLPLPAPVTNVEVETAERAYGVDVYWPEAQLVVELDSIAAHQTAYSFEEDRRRDRALAATGIHTFRVTEHALLNDQSALRRNLIATWESRKDGNLPR